MSKVALSRYTHYHLEIFGIQGLIPVAIPAKQKPIDLSIDSAEILARMVEMSGKSRYAFAKAASMDPAAFYRYLAPAGPKMTTSTLNRVAQANGFRLHVVIGA